MFSPVRMGGIAALLLLLAPWFGAASTALAEDQLDAAASEPATFASRFSALSDPQPDLRQVPATSEPDPLLWLIPPERHPDSSLPRAANEPFGRSTLPLTTGGVVAKWNGLVADIRAEEVALTQCRNDAAVCTPAAQKFMAVIAEGRAHAGRARLGVINRAINLAIRPTSDLAQWGVLDRWSAPLETLATGRGDCEDYAIAKYVALREAGVAEDDLRLVIVRDRALDQDHAVVAARLDDRWIVLDNRRFTLLEDVDVPRVVPLFVLGRDGARRVLPDAVADAAAATPGALGF